MIPETLETNKMDPITAQIITQGGGTQVEQSSCTERAVEIHSIPFVYQLSTDKYMVVKKLLNPEERTIW